MNELAGEIRIHGNKKQGYMLTFSICDKYRTSYEIDAKYIDCEKEIEQLVKKLLEYKS